MGLFHIAVGSGHTRSNQTHTDRTTKFLALIAMSLCDLSTIYLVAATNPHHEHTQSVVLNASDDAGIAYPVLPELTQLGTFEGLPNAAWIFQPSVPT